jgi:hypothetical protein
VTRLLAGERFALFGPIVCNREGSDDRGALKQIILDEGGVLNFELSADGKSSGNLGPMELSGAGAAWRRMLDAPFLLR